MCKKFNFSYFINAYITKSGKVYYSCYSQDFQLLLQQVYLGEKKRIC